MLPVPLKLPMGVISSARSELVRGPVACRHGVGFVLTLQVKAASHWQTRRIFQPRADRTRCLGTVDDTQGSQLRVHCHESETARYCPTEPGSRLGRVAGWHDPRVVPLAAKWQPVATVLTLGAGRGIPDGFQPGMGMNPRSPANRGWGCHCDWG